MYRFDKSRCDYLLRFKRENLFRRFFLTAFFSLLAAMSPAVSILSAQSASYNGNPLSAEEKETRGVKVWRWQDAVSEMERSSPYLASSGYSLDKTRYALKGSYAAFLPSLTASGSAARRIASLSSGSSASSADENTVYSLGLSANLSLFSGFADINTVRIKRNDVTLAELELSRTRADALYKLKNAFVELLWSQEQLSLAREITERRRKNRDLVRLKYESGREDKGSFLRVEADLLRAEYEERKSERQMVSASDNFLRAMGIEPFSGGGRIGEGGGNPEPAARIAESFADILSTGAFYIPGKEISDEKNAKSKTPVGKPDFVSLAMETPEVESARLRLESADYSVNAAISPFWPDLSLGASVNRMGETLPPADGSASVSMSLSWRLFSGGKDYFSLLAERRNKEILEENLRAVKLSVASSLENAWQSMVDAYENLDVGRRYLEAAGAQSEIITAKYLNGLVSYQEWYQVENDYISAKKNYLSAMKDAVLSETLWKNILGISP